MDNKKTVIRKTNLEGKLITVPVRTITSPIPTQIKLSDNLNLGESIIFSQLGRLMSITKERLFNELETKLFDVLMKNMLQIERIKNVALKDLDVENMPHEELMRIAKDWFNEGIS